MADRFTRSNLLSGSVGLGFPKNGNENVLLPVKSVKSTGFGGISNAFTSTNIFSKSTTQTTTVFNSRNALGDIGNKITTTASQQLTIKKDGKVDKVFVPAEVDDEEVELNESSIMDVSNCEITDIDEYDSENTQLVSEYVKDIYGYLTTIEKQFRIAPTFLDSKIVNSKMRSVLVDWLIQVHLKFHLLQETLYLCVQIIDAYLMAVDVPKMQLQLVGVTAMFVASKYEEMYVPAIDDFVYMTDNTYTKAEIRTMEIAILKQLDFMFCKPFPLHFLRRFSKAGQADPKQHTLAKYFMELSLHCAEFSSLDPSYLAASSLALSFKLLRGNEWNRTMEFYSTYKLDSLYMGMHKIAKLVIKSSDIDYRYRAATNKYGTSKFLRISLLPELNGELMKDLANGTNLGNGTIQME
jgi:hypothetical protein